MRETSRWNQDGKVRHTLNKKDIMVFYTLSSSQVPVCIVSVKHRKHESDPRREHQPVPFRSWKKPTQKIRHTWSQLDNTSLPAFTYSHWDLAITVTQLYNHFAIHSQFFSILFFQHFSLTGFRKTVPNHCCITWESPFLILRHSKQKNHVPFWIKEKYRVPIKKSASL